MARFYTLTISEIARETPDCVSLAFAMPDDLQPLFHFKAGQHLTLRTTLEGKEVRRTYSLCSAPHEGKWCVAIKRVVGGLFSNFANDTLRVGDTLDVMPPAGHFTLHEETKIGKHFLAIAAGSGITPIISIIKTALATDSSCRVTLLYSNKHTNSIIFKETLEGLKNRYLQRFAIFYFLTEEQTDSDFLNGRIDAQKLDFFCTKIENPELFDACFLCGPQEMIEIATTILKEKGVEQSKIHFELFGTTTSSQQNDQKKIVQQVASATSLVTIKDAGKTFTFTMSDSHDSILDAALKQGADLPFACKGGVCCTCKARLLEGEVGMVANFALSPQEVSAGFVLTCQAYPKTERVSIDFDQAL